MAASPVEKNVLEDDNSDDNVLAQLGYTQGKRDLVCCKQHADHFS